MPDAASGEGAQDELRLRLQKALSGRYAIGEVIGQGASAIVFAARDLQHFDRDVALKVIRPEVAESVGVARFRREMQVAAQLTHPHILPLLDWGEVGGLLYYAMPRVAGKSLRARLERDHQLALDDAVRITRDVAGALQHAHSLGIVHRDVKPENILLVGGVASLADFGLAREIEGGHERVTASGIAVGTAAYMSPEQASGGGGDARSDQYALACVLYEMLAGDPPFHASTAQAMFARHRADAPPHLTSVRATLPAGVDEAIQRGLAKVPADRFANVAQFAQAVETALTSGTLAAVRAREASGQVPTIAEPRAMHWPRMALGVLAVAALGWWVVKTFKVLPGSRAPALDANRLAVAPFDVFDPADSLWRDGLVDVLSRQLDGAGPLRTVPATTVIEAWSGRADTKSATDLARSTGARLVIFGQLIRIPKDSARLTVSLYDATAGRSVGDIEARDNAVSIDRMVDSVTLGILRELGRTHPIAALRRASLGSRSLPALKAFLQGEQLYRSNDFRSATEYYERAVTLDSTFVLALHRLRNVRAASVSEFDSLARWYGARAGELNHGMPPRDSLIVLADSLAATFVSNSVVASDAWLARLRRRFAVLDEATARYPDDAELWRELGEARLHFGERVGLTQRDALAAFRRAIDLDPRFGPPYFHAVELSAALWGADSAAALARSYRTLNPSDNRFAIVERALTRRGAQLPPLLAGGWNANEPLAEAAYMLRRWADTSEVSIAILRQLMSAGYGDNLVFGDKVRTWLVALLLFRGHIEEAHRVATEESYERIPWHFAHAAVFPTRATGLVDRTLADWSRGSALREAILALPWLFRRKDSVSLRDAAARIDQLRSAGKEKPNAEALTLARYGAATARAYVEMLRGDNAAAARYFAERPDSLCPWWCSMARLDHAQLIRSMNGDEAAARFLDRRPPPGMPVTVAEQVWQLERAQVARRTRDTAYANRLHGVVARMWASADSGVRAMVK